MEPGDDLSQDDWLFRGPSGGAVIVIPQCAIAHLRFVLRTPRNDEGQSKENRAAIAPLSLRHAREGGHPVIASASDRIEKPRRTGYPHSRGYDDLLWSSAVRCFTPGNGSRL